MLLICLENTHDVLKVHHLLKSHSQAASSGPDSCASICNAILPCVLKALEHRQLPEGVSPVGNPQLYALRVAQSIVADVAISAGVKVSDLEEEGAQTVSPKAILDSSWRSCVLLREGLQELAQALVLFGSSLQPSGTDNSQEQQAGMTGDDGMDGEAKILCCKLWHSIAALAELDLRRVWQDDAAGKGDRQHAVLRAGLLHDAAKQLVGWALQVSDLLNHQGCLL